MIYEQKIFFYSVTEINSGEVTHSEKSIKLKATKTQEGFLSRIFSLMNKNPNYKMMGALGVMLMNFSVYVTFAKWIKPQV